MEFEELLEKLYTFEEEQFYLTVACKSYCTDKSVPLDGRWSFFCKGAIGKEHPSCIQHFESLKGTLEEHVFDRYEKYQTAYTEHIAEWLLDKDYHFADYVDDIEEVTRNFKEEVLERYMECFEYDW